MSCSVLELTKQLVRQPSLSPNDAGCNDIMINRLQKIGFTIELMPFYNTNNFWAWHGKGRTLAFAGHTDVVPIGNEKHWNSLPFEPILKNGILYGRGVADMKGSLAAMIVATERFIIKYPNHQGRLAFLITSDEEAEAQNGTVKVVETLMARKERIDYCLIGEPSSNYYLGDTIKNGRRGSLTANLVVQGVQGHVAYLDMNENPIHLSIALLNELIKTEWDKGNDFFSPTTMQITNIHASSGSGNTIPNELIVKFNFRFNTELTDTIIRRQVEKLMQNYGLHYQINWWLSGEPFLTKCGELVDAVMHTVKYYQKFTPRLETTGGTSDGRFIIHLGAQIVELGLVNSTIHKVNECANINDLQLLSHMYQHIIEQLL